MNKITFVSLVIGFGAASYVFAYPAPKALAVNHAQTHMSAEQASETETATSSSSTPATIDMTALTNEMAMLSSQESQILAQKQTALIAATSLQTKDTMQQAEQMITSGNMLMTEAMLGLVVSASASMVQYNMNMLSAEAENDQEKMMDTEADTEQMQQIINTTNQQMSQLLHSLNEQIYATSNALSKMQTPLQN